jgi:glycosyltransferase involved in cell wall biosynthesis
VLLIVGDGPLMENLQKEADRLPIIFTGIRKDMPRIYSAMDIFVLPSLIEGLPMALLEAMASKKPIVATRVGAIPQVIQDGHSGYLIDPGDTEGLAIAIMGLLADPQKAGKMAGNAYKVVREHYSSQKMAKEYEQVYREVLKDNCG